MTVAELDWGNEEQIKAVSPPFDLVVAADVVSFDSPRPVGEELSVEVESYVVESESDSTGPHHV